MTQSDLFDTGILPGLTETESLVSDVEEAELIRHIDAEPLSPFRFQGWLGKRLTRSFGWSYDFDRGRLRTWRPYAGLAGVGTRTRSRLRRPRPG